MVRARQRRRDDKTGDQVLPILVHGDAAFAGQGVVTTQPESGNSAATAPEAPSTSSSTTRSATTSDRAMRSTIYCTDVAKMVEAPIFHVNGDDPSRFSSRRALRSITARPSTRTW